jgi:UbiD family decarboxylase
MTDDQSMRGALGQARHSDALRVIERPVDRRFEIAAATSHAGAATALLFTSVIGAQMPVVTNLLGTRERLAAALGQTPATLQAYLLAALDGGIAPELVAAAPVQQVVHLAPLDVGAILPVPTWFEHERGPYITAGVIIARDPDTGRRNVSIARLLLLGGERLMAGIAPTHHLSELLRRSAAHGRPLEIAVAIGNHPATLLASQMYVELGRDELDIAGALLGAPLRLVPARTVDLAVPAEAEIVIEATLHADQPVEEGRVSEFPGFYVTYGAGHGVTVRAITHRRDAIYQAIMPGYEPEHCLLGGTAIAATTCRALRRVIPAVRAVHLTDGGMGRLHAVISMHQPRRGEGKRAIMLAMGHVNLLKWVTVVDDDIDPANPQHVEWAVATRMRADRDLFVVPGVRADRCEPQHDELTVAKVGIVATSQPGDGAAGGRFERALPPAAVRARVADWMDAAAAPDPDA